MKLAILIHGIIELIAGIVVFFLPHLLLMNNGLSPETLSVCKLYGIAASFLGILSLLIYRYSTDEKFNKNVVLSIMAFHMILGFYLSGLLKAEIVLHAGVYISHLVILGIISLIYLKHIK